MFDLFLLSLVLLSKYVSANRESVKYVNVSGTQESMKYVMILLAMYS
jgi:hypothetical protein